MKNRIKILFLCHGNICRSPMAQYVFQKMVDQAGLQDFFEIDSAATSTEEIGNDMHYGTKEQLKTHNIPFERHYAKQINLEDYNNFDLIICFDSYNYNNLVRMFNKSDKIIKLLDKDIDDPWYTHNFVKTYDDIYNGCMKLLERMDNNE